MKLALRSIITLTGFIFFVKILPAQSVGIGTLVPQARLHVADSNVLFTGPMNVVEATAWPPPQQGPGARLMWYPQKAAFRAGLVFGNHWDKDSIGLLSVALGNSTKAKGESAFASGAGTNAIGIRSTAMGDFSTASGDGAFAVGSSSSANGKNSVAMGSHSVAAGDYSFVHGTGNIATGFASVAMGQVSIADANTAVAIGYDARATASFSTAIGYSALASGQNAFSFGRNSIASGNIAFATGYETRSKADYSTTVGAYNDTTDAPGIFNPQQSDRIFQVGNGTANNARRNAITVLRNGNVGLENITNPDAPLTFANTFGKKISLYSSSAGNQFGFGVQSNLMQIYTDAAASNIAFGYSSGSFFQERMRILTSSGYDGMILAGRLHLKNGSFDFTGGGGGIWLYPPNGNTQLAFIGTQTAQNVGIYGGPANWGFVYNTTNSCIGIGNQNPTRPLSFPAALGEKILLYPGGTGEVGIGVYGNELRIHTDYAAAKISFGYQDNAGTFTEKMWLNNNTGVLTVNGTAYPSDIRFKKQISNIQDPLKKILALNGVEYFMRSEQFPQMHFNTDKQVGLLAQEVEKVLPQAVQVINDDGYKGVDYAKLVPLLIEAIKQLKNELDEVKSKIKN